MVANGLLKEVDWIAKKYKEANKVMDYTKGVCQSIGLKEFAPYLVCKEQGRSDDELRQVISECVEQLKTNTRRYAKKQVLWISHHLVTQLASSTQRHTPILCFDTAST